jgi:glycerophosphoryl diester phosphodiesterase
LTIFYSIFFSAYEVGTEMMEIDCQITQDGEVVVSHDNILERTAGHDIRISETDYKVSGQNIAGVQIIEHFKF